jgi:hypothetical protein
MRGIDIFISTKTSVDTEMCCPKGKKIFLNKYLLSGSIGNQILSSVTLETLGI